jgi:hypothetical protein
MAPLEAIMTSIRTLWDLDCQARGESLRDLYETAAVGLGIEG